MRAAYHAAAPTSPRLPLTPLTEMTLDACFIIARAQQMTHASAARCRRHIGRPTLAMGYEPIPARPFSTCHDATSSPQPPPARQDEPLTLTASTPPPCATGRRFMRVASGVTTAGAAGRAGAVKRGRTRAAGAPANMLLPAVRHAHGAPRKLAAGHGAGRRFSAPTGRREHVTAARHDSFRRRRQCVRQQGAARRAPQG